MACRESGCRKVLLCLGLFLVASSFCHCARLTKLKALDRFRGNSPLRQGKATESNLSLGRLLIGQNSLQGAKGKGSKATKNLLDVDTDYQADMGWGEPTQHKGQVDGFSMLMPDNAAVERLLKMEPKVECTGNSMKLKVQDATSTAGSLFFVDRGNHLSPLPLSKLPPSCGYTIKSTMRDLVLVAPYDGCFVSLEEDNYVLPLRWWGLLVRMSCPLMRPSSPNPPMVTCHSEGMVVKVEWAVSVAKIRVNMGGDWEKLMKASARCGFSVVAHPEGVVISVRYAPCLEKRDGMYTFELAGNGETKISCPSLSPAQFKPTSQANGSTPQTETPSKAVYSSIPSHNSASTHAPEPTPENPAQYSPVPVFPQDPNKGPKNIYQPQLPNLSFYPNFYYPYPENLDTKPTPTEQPPPPHVTNKNDGLQSQTVPPAKSAVTPESQVPHPFITSPFYPWPAQPEVPVEKEPPVQPPATQQPNDQVKQPLHPSPIYVKPPNPDGVPHAKRPELELLPSKFPPVVKMTNGLRPDELKHLYPLPLYPLPPASEAPQVRPPYPLYPENPETPLSEQPVPPQPPVSEPQGQRHQPFYSYHPQPEPEETPTAVPWAEAPQGKLQQPFYPYHPQSEPEETPTAVPWAEAPQGKLQQPFYPYHPQSEPEETPTAVPWVEAPQGQLQQPFYPYHPQPEPEEKPTAVPWPEAPQGQLQQPFYPYHPQPEPEETPTAVPKPPATETPKRPKPFYHQPSKIQGAETKGDKSPTENPVQSEQPPAVKPTEGLVHHSLDPYYYPQQPQRPQPVTSLSAASMQQTQVTTSASNQRPLGSDIDGIIPQLGFPYMPPVYCPQFCPSGFSNCCPQITFHQHLHHIVPAGLGSKDAPSVYSGLPFPFSVAYSWLGNGLGSSPLPQTPTEATTMQAAISAPISPQSLPSGNEQQPPDGNPAALTRSNPSKPTNPKQPIYSHQVPNSLYHNWPYLLQNEELQNLPQSQSRAYYNMPSKPWAPGNEPVNPVVQYQPYNIHPQKQQNSQLSARDINSPSGFNFMSLNGQYLQWQQNEPKPYHEKSTDSKGPTHPKVQSEQNRLASYMLQDAQSPASNKWVVPKNSPQPFVSGSKKSNKYELPVHSYSEPRSYLLLQHGPPGREPGKSKPQHLQNLNPSQEKPKHPKWLGKEMSNPLPTNYMPRPGDKLASLFYSALADPYFEPLPQDPSPSVAHVRPKFLESFQDLRKPMPPLGSSRTSPPQVPGNTFQRWSSAADQQANGLNQHLQKEAGNRKQK